jgi:hypothetical protein
MVNFNPKIKERKNKLVREGRYVQYILVRAGRRDFILIATLKCNLLDNKKFGYFSSDINPLTPNDF